MGCVCCVCCVGDVVGTRFLALVRTWRCLAAFSVGLDGGLHEMAWPGDLDRAGRGVTIIIIIIIIRHGWGRRIGVLGHGFHLALALDEPHKS